MTVTPADVLVVGLGNPILSDDGIGWRVVTALRDVFRADPVRYEKRVELREVGVGGLSLAEMFIGYRRVIIVDAIMTESGTPGTVYQLKLADLPGTLNMASAHDTNLSTALRALRRFGASVPGDDAIDIVAIEAQDIWTFAESCTPPVENALAEAVALVRALVDKTG